MKWWPLGIVLGLMLSAAIRSPAGAPPPREPHRPRWHTHYERAKELARREGKPLFVVFR